VEPSKWAEFLKLTPRYFFALCATAAVLLWLTSFGEEAAVAKYRFWIVVVFIFCGTLWVTHGLAALVQDAKNKWCERQKLKLKQKRLHDLTWDEKQVLGKYIKERTRTQEYRNNNGVVLGLIMEGILQRVVIGDLAVYANVDINIQSWAWEYLKENPQLVE